MPSYNIAYSYYRNKNNYQLLLDLSKDETKMILQKRPKSDIITHIIIYISIVKKVNINGYLNYIFNN